MDKTLTAFIWVWVSMILLANIFGIWGLFASADSTDDAMQQFREIYSPTNIAELAARDRGIVAGYRCLHLA